MYKLQAKSVIECTPTLLFLLITVCPNRIEFCWLLLIVCWIIVLTIARSYLTKVVFYTILIDNGWPNAWMWEILEFYFYQGMEAKAHWLYIEPQFTRDKGWIVIWALLSPIQHRRTKTVQLFQPDVPDVS